MKENKIIESIINIIPEDYSKNIKSIDVKVSSEGTRMLIFNLSRDQRLKFRKLIPLLEDGKNTSFYIKLDSRFHHIGGFTHVFDKVNEYNYNISPYSPLKTLKQSALYRTIRNSSPKGTTRNAIIINTHCGLIPVHLSKLYNRMYCVDVERNYTDEARLNLKINRINNCLFFSSNTNKWLKEFEGHKYTLPGRKHKIGLFVCDATLLSKESCDLLFNIEPETVILFSEDKEAINNIGTLIETKDNYEKTFESLTEGFYIRKIKRKEGIGS
ncbi:MAG: hypothetical protein NTY22_03040 [Proteobacteria bacterium]|nr:hypothetical protein [Pseudomonadota bacterium]